jgi:predicted GIY-YIG superfamily endonuclease
MRRERRGRSESPRDRTVYVIALDPTVMAKKGYRDANTQYAAGKPCVYVGMTALTPEARYQQHKSGAQANRYVRDFGLRILEKECVSELSYQDAQVQEVQLATELRDRGWAAWQK